MRFISIDNCFLPAALTAGQLLAFLGADFRFQLAHRWFIADFGGERGEEGMSRQVLVRRRLQIDDVRRRTQEVLRSTVGICFEMGSIRSTT